MPIEGKLPSQIARHTFWTVIMALFLTVTGAAQTLSNSPGQTGNAGSSAAQLPVLQPMTLEAGGPAYLDQIIEPDDYRVGPGDLLFVNIWGSRPEEYQIEITPEAVLIIPGAGELYTAGMTLTELKAACIARLREFYPRTPISVTLGKVRRFRVTVTGTVERPGLHVVTANTRASEVLDAAGLRDDAARRRVRLERRDTTMLVDLAAFERLGLREANPYLSEGDVIIVPPIDRRWGNVRVEGAVHLVGEFGFSPGDLMGDAIDLAFGLRPDADTTRVELWRFMPASLDATLFAWPPGSSFSDWRRFALHPDDRIIIRSIDGYRVKRGVQLTGEVHREGYYAIPSESITLRSLIDSAGGFTPHADLDHAMVIRSIQPDWVGADRERVALVPPELRSRSEEDFLLANALTIQGRVAADFEKLFRGGDETHNISLYDGDEVIVPRMTESISIIGRVVQPGLVPLKVGENLDYYIERAGGFAWQADRGGTFLVKGGTGAAVKKKRIGEITSGDTIVVPTRRERRWWQAFRETLTVTTGLATLYLVIDQVTQ